MNQRYPNEGPNPTGGYPQGNVPGNQNRGGQEPWQERGWSGSHQGDWNPASQQHQQYNPRYQGEAGNYYSGGNQGMTSAQAPGSAQDPYAGQYTATQFGGGQYGGGQMGGSYGSSSGSGFQGGQGHTQGPWGPYPDNLHQQGGPQSGSHQDVFDPDYYQWRSDRMRSFDDDYRNWRQERFRRFSDEFDQWRQGRTGTQGEGGKGQGASSNRGGIGSGGDAEQSPQQHSVARKGGSGEASGSDDDGTRAGRTASHESGSKSK